MIMTLRSSFLICSYCLSYSAWGSWADLSWDIMTSYCDRHSDRVMMSSLTTATISSTTSWPAKTDADPTSPAKTNAAMVLLIRPTSDS